MENKQPAQYRIETNNKCLNRSDVYKVQQLKQVNAEAKKAKEEERKKKRDEKEAKLAQQTKENHFLELSGLVACGCKAKCTKRCKCNKNDQRCIYLCKCPCADKNDSAKNQFNAEQLLNHNK